MKNKVLSVLAGLLLVAIVTGAGYALFSATVRSSTNRMKSGTVDVALHGGVSILYQISPGEWGYHEYKIKNTGNLPAIIQVDFDTKGQLFEGETPVELWTGYYHEHLAVGETKEIFVYWEMPIDAGNEYQGTTGEYTLVVTATQAIEAYP